MINIFFTAFYFLLPAGVANSTPVLAAKLPFLKKFNYPLDFNKKIHGKPILGKGKTIRGIITGVLAGVLIFYLQKNLYQDSATIQNLVSINYSLLPLSFGILVSTGALFGDLVKSFFKRRLRIASGEPWIPFDQIDFLLGSIILSYFYIRLEFEVYLIVFVLGISLHFLTNILAYILKLKDVPY